MVAAWFRFKSVRFYLQWDIRSFLRPARFISLLPPFRIPYSSSPYTSFSFHDSRTLGRLISNRTVIKALQPGLVVNPVLDLFWDAIICCVITSSVSPSVTARAWSELDAGGWKQGCFEAHGSEINCGWSWQMRRKAWRTGAVMNKSAFYPSGHRGPALDSSMTGFVRMRVCCVEIDRWTGGSAVLTILLLGQMGGGVDAKGGV